MTETIETFICQEISREDADLGNVIFGAKGPVEIELCGEAYRLCFLPGFPTAFHPALRYELSICGRKALLEMDRLPFPKLLGYPDGGLDPAQVHADLLVPLLESVLDKVRASAERFLGGEIRVVSATVETGPEHGNGIEAVDTGMAEGRAWLCVDAIGPDKRIRSRLLLDPSDASALAGVFRGRERARNRGWLSMPVPIRFRAGHTMITAEEAASLAGGDILLLSADPLAPGAIRLEAGVGKGAAWTATWKKTNVCVEGLMMEDANETAADGNGIGTANGAGAIETSETKGVGALEKIEVHLSFDLGTRLMSLAELGGVTAGTVLTLPENPEGKITIRVSGKAIGVGYLIKVGGRTGVRIESIGERTDGAR